MPNRTDPFNYHFRPEAARNPVYTSSPPPSSPPQRIQRRVRAPNVRPGLHALGRLPRRLGRPVLHLGAAATTKAAASPALETVVVEPVGFHSAAQASGEVAGAGFQKAVELWQGDGCGGDGG
jgi:hypothetical protein